MQRSPIEWTDFTANPLKYRTPDGRVVWACEKLSPGCTNCYADSLSHRYGGTRRAGDWNAGVMATLTPFLDEQELAAMLTYKPAAGKRCFVGDMTDMFGRWVSDALLDRLFAVFAIRSDVTWQVLTKRADRMRAYCAQRPNGGESQFFSVARYGSTAVLWERPDLQPWPLPHVHLGVSGEDQKRLDERVRHLVNTPAAVRFVSLEPLLEAVMLDNGESSYASCRSTITAEEYEAMTPKQQENHSCCLSWDLHGEHFHGVDWVIVGGESGPGARPFDLAWARSIVQQCQAAGVPVFVKQVGANAVVRNDDRDEGWPGCTVPLDDDYEPREQGELGPLVFRDKKGGDPAEWPADLRVRQFPEARA